MAKPNNIDIEDVRAEARKYEQETGRPVDIHEKCVESSDGKRTRTFGWKTRKQKVGEAIALLRKSGFKPVRDEDGVVRLHCLELETPITAKNERITAKDAKNAKKKKGRIDAQADDSEDEPAGQGKTASPRRGRGHVEVTAWPIRSPETAALITSFLFEKGWDGFAPRELKEMALILEGDALRKQEPIDTATAAEWNPLLAGILHHFDVTCRSWQGTATQLLETLASLCQIDKLNWVKSPDWPTCPRTLSVELDRITPWLADEGIVWRRHHTGQERRLILEYAADTDAGEIDDECEAEVQDVTLSVDACVGSAVRTTRDAGFEVETNPDAEPAARTKTDAETVPASNPALVANSLVKSELGGSLTQTNAGFRDFSHESSVVAGASVLARIPNPKSLTPSQRKQVRILLVEELYARETRELRARKDQQRVGPAVRTKDGLKSATAKSAKIAKKEKEKR